MCIFHAAELQDSSRGCHLQDADQLWAVTPPAEAALWQLLSSHAAELRIGWRVERTAPPASAHGGPACDGSVAVRLAGASRSQLLDVLGVRLLAAP